MEGIHCLFVEGWKWDFTRLTVPAIKPHDFHTIGFAFWITVNVIKIKSEIGAEDVLLMLITVMKH